MGYYLQHVFRFQTLYIVTNWKLAKERKDGKMNSIKARSLLLWLGMKKKIKSQIQHVFHCLLPMKNPFHSEIRSYHHQFQQYRYGNVNISSQKHSTMARLSNPQLLYAYLCLVSTHQIQLGPILTNILNLDLRLTLKNKLIFNSIVT